MMPGSLCAAADYLNKHPDCMWLTGDTVYFDVHGIIQRCLYGPYWNTWLMKQTLVCNMVNGPSSIFHRSLFEKAGGFDTQLSYTMDMDLWFKFVDCGACFHRPHRYIWGFRIHEGSKTSHAINGYLADEFTYERDKAILRAKRTRKQTEFWWLRLWKFVTGTHFHTLYDTWRWRHLSIEKK